MKKLISLLLVASVGTALIGGCSNNAADNSVSETEQTTSAEVLLGAAGQASTDTSAWAMTDDRQALFDAATDGLLGADYEAVLCLGVPESNPLGTVFLCRTTYVTPDADPFWTFVTVQDVGSSVTVEDVKAIQYARSTTSADLYLADEPDEVIIGGWASTEDIEIPSEVLDAFNEVFGEELSGAVPCALLATQVINGTNYCILVNDAGQWKCAFLSVTPSGNFPLTVASITL